MNDNKQINDFVGDDYKEENGFEMPDPIYHTIDCYGSPFEIKLFKKPNSNCKKCFGRGHRGKVTNSKGTFPNICTCIEDVRYIEKEEFEQMKEVAESMKLI